ncbi:MAG TPA: HdeD family acid-resistance protein, partial [Anaerolineae bacterium]
LTLIYLFGAYALVDGIFAVIGGIQSHGRNERWWALLLEGIAGIILGVLTFIWPQVTGLILLYFIAAWAIITGIFEIVAAIQLRRAITGEWLMILSGILSIVFGVLLVIFPGAGALGLTWLIGAYAIIFGILFIILAFRLRGMRGEEVGTTDGSRPSPA